MLTSRESWGLIIEHWIRLCYPLENHRLNKTIRSQLQWDIGSRLNRYSIIISNCTYRPWPLKRTYQFRANRMQISAHSCKTAFCVGGTELTNQRKINPSQGKPFVDEVMSRCRHVMIITGVRWRTRNFIFTSHCLAMVSSDKNHGFFSNNPCYISHKDTNTEC